MFCKDSVGTNFKLTYELLEAYFMHYSVIVADKRLYLATICSNLHENICCGDSLEVPW